MSASLLFAACLPPPIHLPAISQALQFSSYVDFKKCLIPFYRTITPIIPAMLRTQHCTQRHDIVTDRH